MLSPFLAADTREKIIMISGEDRKEETLSEWIDSDQATPLLLPDGKLSSDIDVDRFLNQVPFYRLYDDVVS